MSLATLAQGHFGLRGIICTNLLEVHKVMQHTKYQSSRPYGFGQEDFLCFFPYISLSKACDPWGVAIFGPKGSNLNKLGRGPPDDASYQISRL